MHGRHDQGIGQAFHQIGMALRKINDRARHLAERDHAIGAKALLRLGREIIFLLGKEADQIFLAAPTRKHRIPG